MGDAARVFFREIGKSAQLLRADNSIGEADSHHKIREGLAFAPGPADCAGAVALRIDSPPAEIGLDPFIGNRAVTVARKVAYLFQALPGVLDRLKPLRPLCLGLFRLCLYAHFSIVPVQIQCKKQKAYRFLWR